jgi:hypothetical protein
MQLLAFQSLHFQSLLHGARQAALSEIKTEHVIDTENAKISILLHLKTVLCLLPVKSKKMSLPTIKARAGCTA